jgi:hypothetical protein
MFKHLAACTLLATAPALAQVTTIQNANSTPPSTNDLDKVVCEMVHRTGSRLEVDKVCMTVRQWSDHKAGHRADVEKVQQVVNQSPSG